MMAFIRKHRNPLLLLCLLITLAISWFATNKRLVEAAVTVSLPVEPAATAVPSSRLEQFRAQQEAAFLADTASLQALCDQDTLSEATREDAARQLQQLIATREQQLALEGALSQSTLYPCVAVIAEGSVTLVTDKTTLSDGERALVLTLAQAHAGVDPSGVRVITAEEAD